MPSLAATSPASGPHPGMGFPAFVVLMALLMALGALGIDAMLPVLPTIAHSLGGGESNSQQWIITAYLLGFGLAQIIYGSLADRYGRKPVLLVGLTIFTLASIAAAFAPGADPGADLDALLGQQKIGEAILRAIARERPVGVIHFDAHSDTGDTYFGGEKAVPVQPVDVERPIPAPQARQIVGKGGAQGGADIDLFLITI